MDATNPYRGQQQQEASQPSEPKPAEEKEKVLGSPERDHEVRFAFVTMPCYGWGNQHYPHALVAETPFFTVQLKRYEFRDGRAHKRTDPVALRPNAVVRMPIFCTGESVSVRTATYRLLFAIVHTGDTPHAGHYQAALSCGSRFYLSDDRVASRPMKEHEQQWLAQNCYLLGLLRHE
ncbi:hypothetical protein AK812_SmicGene15049 [Symbiodinium microadriaticum]|uniref:Peptidase C19 ubiquitin carboxyl-terminal hydrolase domain-containing protein n=1 Tax=Symbiodinium microadriaticum TaxID=2951 RepID=A0A1Q9E3W8_SYMMI|nr:hypothetical protein AK812_SmicGene15049 [Symbiodinium microadriaticum]